MFGAGKQKTHFPIGVQAARGGLAETNDTFNHVITESNRFIAFKSPITDSCTSSDSYTQPLCNHEAFKYRGDYYFVPGRCLIDSRPQISGNFHPRRTRHRRDGKGGTVERTASSRYRKTKRRRRRRTLFGGVLRRVLGFLWSIIELGRIPKHRKRRVGRKISDVVNCDSLVVTDPHPQSALRLARAVMFLLVAPRQRIEQGLHRQLGELLRLS